MDNLNSKCFKNKILTEDDYDKWIKDEKSKSKFWKLFLGTVIFFAIIITLVILYYLIIAPVEKSCMELMDMDFQTEQECVDFVLSLVEQIEGRVDDPKVRELLNQWAPMVP